jgi:hypothetical protein
MEEGSVVRPLDWARFTSLKYLGDIVPPAVRLPRGDAQQLIKDEEEDDDEDEGYSNRFAHANPSKNARTCLPRTW